jgi:DNA-directed RNA polymerase specialized sigma24 family protein
MATRKKTVRKKLAEADNIIEEQIEVINEQLEKVQRMMRPYEQLKDRENRLRAARRALLGGSSVTREGNSQIRKEDIVEILKETPGMAPGQIAQHLGVPQTTVSSHLYRGKDARFLSKDGRWYLRDPKAGINTSDDIEEE